MRNREQGMAFVWLIGLVVVFGGLAALTIDILRVQSILRQAQNAADAAALAGARQLKGNIASWGTAKRATVEALRAQHIAGISDSSLENLEFNESSSTPDYFEALLGQSGAQDAERYLYSQGSVGSLKFTVERGAYWDIDGKFEFKSLEGSSGTNGEPYLSKVARPVSYLQMQGVSQIPVQYDMPVHLLANAVRVTVEATGIQAFFGKFVGISTFDTMSRNAVAISDSTINYPVLPLAIPACALLLDTQLTAGDYQYDTETFEPERECVRETVFTESNPLGPKPPNEVIAPYDARAKGIFRADSYPKRATKRTLPLRGVLGIPLGTKSDSDTEGNPATPEELIQSLERLAAPGGTDGLRASLGERFLPLENGVFPQGLLSDLSNAQKATEYVETLISRGAPFVDAFTAGGQPKLNYPALRSESPNRQQEDVYVKYGPEVTLVMRQFPRTPYGSLPDFLNPMCTTERLRAQPIEDRKALEAVVMVVSPTATDPDGQPYHYCDYKSVFAGVEQNTFAPLDVTKPRVVGFVKAHIFDLHLVDFDSPPDYQPNAPVPGEDPQNPNPAGVIMTGMYKPFIKSSPHFIEEHRDWHVCLEQQRACEHSHQRPPGGCPSCTSEPQHPPVPPATKWNEVKENGCFDMPSFNEIRNCVENPPDTEPLRFVRCLGLFVQAASPMGYPSLPDVVARGDQCLPRKKPDCDQPATEDSSCWLPPEPFGPQYGCGGIRARISCDDARLTTPGSISDRRPMLVH